MTLFDLLKDSAARHPGRTALIYRGKTWTYGGLLESVRKASAGLRRSGIGKGDRVALLMKNSPEFVITVFALGRIGAAAVPINFILNPEEVEYICVDSGTTAIVTQPAFLDTVRAVLANAAALKTVWVADANAQDLAGTSFKQFSSLLESPVQSEESEGTDVTEDQTILILYTSGTTGNPKGAMLSHSNVTSNTLASIEALAIKSEDRFMCVLPMFHVFAWTTNVCIPLHLGCPIVIIESLRPPKPWLKLLFRHRVTVFGAVPQIYAVLAEQARGFKKWVLRFVFFGSVRFCISGAAPLLAKTLRMFEDRLHVPLLEGYGLTETSPVVSANTLTARKTGSVGKCVPGVRVKIIDENEKELASGQEGEICISGPSLMQGYHNLPDATREAFTRDGWFRTGDVGVVDVEGFIFIRDRIKDMIIVKGLKIYSVQVEEVLLRHPAVAEAAVVGIPNPSGDETIKAFVVLEKDLKAEPSELIRFCQDKLAGYKRPREIEILKELPKNALQKVLKRELRARGKE